MSSGMGFQPHQDIQNSTEQATQAFVSPETLVGGRTDLNLPLAPPIPSYPYPYMLMQNPLHLDALNQTRINYGPPMVENLQQQEANAFNQDIYLQRASLYNALQRSNLPPRPTPYHLHQAIQEQLQNYHQEQQLQQQNFLRGYQSEQFGQQFAPRAVGGDRQVQTGTESIFGQRMPQVRQPQRIRRRRANRAHVMHINSVAAEMAHQGDTTATSNPVAPVTNPSEIQSSNPQSFIHIDVRQERICGLSAAVTAEEVSTIGENFECNICFQNANEAVVTCCGHLFCWPCLYRWLHVHSSHKECPVCKGSIAECSITPIYGRENALVSARIQGLGTERIPPRPQARRVESERQLREREEREREREIRENFEELERTNTASMETQLVENIRDGHGDGVASSLSGGNILIHLDHRELNATNLNIDVRELGGTDITEISTRILPAEQRSHVTHTNVENTDRNQESDANLNLDDIEDISNINTTLEERGVQSTANMTMDQREANTRNILWDLPGVEDLQPNVLRGGSIRELREELGNPLLENRRGGILHRRMAHRREQLHAALSALRSNVGQVHRDGERQEMTQAAALLSQEWDDIINIAANPGQAAPWMQSMNERLVNMETSLNYTSPQSLNYTPPQSLNYTPPQSLNQNHISESIDNPTRPTTNSISQASDLLAAMRTRFNNIQRIMESLQCPSTIVMANLEPLNSGRLSSEVAAIPENSSTEHPSSGASGSSSEDLNPRRSLDTGGCIEVVPSSRLRCGVSSLQEHCTKVLEDPYSYVNSLDSVSSLPFAATNEPRHRRIERNSRGEESGRAGRSNRNDNGEVVVLNSEVENHAYLESEQILRMPREEEDEEDDVGVEVQEATHERKRRRMTDIV